MRPRGDKARSSCMSVDASQRVKHIGLNPTDLSRILGKFRAAPHVYDFHASVAFRHDASVSTRFRLYRIL